MISGGQPLCKGDEAPTARYNCHNMQLGRLLTKACELGLGDMFLPHAGKPRYTSSASAIVKSLETTREIMMKGNRHKGCNIMERTITLIKERIRKLSEPWTDQQVKFLKTQALKTGVLNDEIGKGSGRV